MSWLRMSSRGVAYQGTCHNNRLSKVHPNEFGDEKHFSLSCTPFQDDRYHVQKNKLILSQVKESES